MTLAVMLKKASRIYGRLPPRLAAEPWFEPLPGVFNPALLPLDRFHPNRVQFVCRKHYYELDRRGIMIDSPRREATVNWLYEGVVESGSLRVLSRAPIEAFDGIEDLRFYEHEGRLYVTGTRPDFETHARSAPFLASAARIHAAMTPQDLQLCENPPELAEREKNWVFFTDDRRLYLERMPGLEDIFEVDVATGRLDRRGPAGQLSGWSGTKAASWMGGTLFLDHKRVYPLRGFETLVRFVFRFRYRHPRLGTVALSPEFSLQDDLTDLVYASDLVLLGGFAFIGIGINDGAAQILKCPLVHIEQMLHL